MRILACPGQGSQASGFMTPWLELPEFAETISILSEAAGLDLKYFGTEADEDTIRDTAIAQPLIVAAGLAAARAEWGAVENHFEGVVGHSVGEFTAAALAGVISDIDAVRLVRARALAMAAASAIAPSSMAAVLGADGQQAKQLAAEFQLEIANFNGAGQYVLAGSKPGIQALTAATLPGIRIIELKVAGAFHTSYMQSAIEPLSTAAASVASRAPVLRLWSNQDGTELQDGSEVVARLISQVARPVRFDLCLENLTSAELFVELPPAGALAGLAKRALSGVTVALKSPQDFEKLENH